MTKLLLLAGAAALIVASPAYACRGTTEYPAVKAQFAKADIPDAERRAIASDIDRGWAIHEEGHRQLDPEKMRESVRILDEIKAKLKM